MQAFAQSHYEEAEKRWLAALESARAFGERDSRFLASLENLGNLYRTQGRYTTAEPHYRRALVILEKTVGPEHLHVAERLNVLARIYHAKGEYPKAERLAQRALAIRENSLGDEHSDVAESLINLAEIYLAQGEYTKVEPLSRRALAIWEKVLDAEHPNVALALNIKADLYKAQGHYAKAEPLYRRALAIKENALGPEHQDVAQSLNSLATLYRTRGQYATAEPLDRRALVILEKALGPEHPEVAQILNNLAGVYFANSQYVKAERMSQRALAIREKSLGPEHPKFAVSLNNLANIYSILGQYAKAEPLYRRALAVKEKALGPEHSGTAESLYNLAKLYLDHGRYAKAEPLSQRALDIWQKTLGAEHPYVGYALINRAELYQSQGQYATAEPLYRRALVILEKILGPEHPHVAYNLRNLGLLHHAQGQYAEAELLYHRALVILEKVLGPEHPDVASNLNSLASLHFRRGEYTEAVSFARRATAIHRNRLVPLNEHRSESSLSVRDSYRSGFFLHVQLISRLIEDQPKRRQALVQEAFEVSQLIQTSRTAAAVAQMAVRSATGDPALSRSVHTHQDVINQWRALNAIRLKRWSTSAKVDGRQGESSLGLRSQLASLEDRIQTLKTQLHQQFPQYAELNDPKPVTLADTQRLLAPDEALLAYLIGEEESYLWVVRRDLSAMQRLTITKEALTQAVSKLRKALNKDDIRPFNLKLAHRLYSQLIAPAKPLLGGVQHIILKPDSALHSLPFAALITVPPKTTFVFAKRYRQLPWLGKEYAFSALPAVGSLKILRSLAQSPLANEPFTGFGAPVFQDHQSGLAKATYTRAFRGVLADITYLQRLAPLPETATELKWMADYLNASDEALYLGDRATESQVKSLDLSSVRILAFSTHGLLAHETEALRGPAEPALVLTPPPVATERDDGLLSASEVAQLNLNADWVILSACNTAVPDNSSGGEGLSELAKAFFYAGSRGLLVSHWYVDSLATSKLMIGTFEQLAKHPHMRRAEALRVAMMNLVGDTEYAHPIYWAPFLVVGEGGSVTPKSSI